MEIGCIKVVVVGVFCWYGTQYMYSTSQPSICACTLRFECTIPILFLNFSLGLGSIFLEKGSKRDHHLARSLFLVPNSVIGALNAQCLIVLTFMHQSCSTKRGPFNKLCLIPGCTKQFLLCRPDFILIKLNLGTSGSTQPNQGILALIVAQLSWYGAVMDGFLNLAP